MCVCSVDACVRSTRALRTGSYALVRTIQLGFWCLLVWRQARIMVPFLPCHSMFYLFIICYLFNTHKHARPHANVYVWYACENKYIHSLLPITRTRVHACTRENATKQPLTQARPIACCCCCCCCPPYRHHTLIYMQSVLSSLDNAHMHAVCAPNAPNLSPRHAGDARARNVVFREESATYNGVPVFLRGFSCDSSWKFIYHHVRARIMGVLRCLRSSLVSIGYRGFERESILSELLIKSCERIIYYEKNISSSSSEDLTCANNKLLICSS